MRTGFSAANGEKIIVIDGDATYPAAILPEISNQLDRHDVVRCVRSTGRDNIPLLNRLGNLFFDQLLQRVHWVEGSDVLSGLYGLHRRHLLAMRLEANGFDIETEIVVKASAMALTAHSMPIEYSERIGEKKLKPFRDGWTILLRSLRLTAIFNPFATYIVPGMLLWLIAIVGLMALSLGPITTSFGELRTNTLIVSAMAFLTGFQLLMLGCVVNIYVAQNGMRRPSRLLGFLVTQTVRLTNYSLAMLLMLAGGIWACALFVGWVLDGLGAFQSTEMLVIALAMVVWGVQLLSTTLFLALFARDYPSTDRVPTRAAMMVAQNEREVGGKQ